jgi:hypothetical protein
MAKTRSDIKNNYQEIVLEDIQECFTLFTQLWQSGYYFRGASSAAFGLSTTLERYAADHYALREAYLIKEFKRRIHHYLSVQDMPGSTLELLALMQHYGAPTRLLDLTRSPYVALYFAVRDVLNINDSSVWAFVPENLNFFSLAKLKHKYPNVMAGLQELTTDQLQLFITEEYFQETFMSNRYDVIMALEPVKMNLRLNIQQGQFLIGGGSDSFANTLSGLLQEMIAYTPHIDQPTVIKCIIPHHIKASMLKVLDSMNLNAATLFGGLEGFSVSLREKISALDLKELGN